MKQERSSTHTTGEPMDTTSMVLARHIFKQLSDLAHALTINYYCVIKKVNKQIEAKIRNFKLD